MNQQPKYRFYPSLLDKFEQYLRADEPYIKTGYVTHWRPI